MQRRSGRLYVCEILARVFISLAMLVMLASPFTECIAHLDSFPRGGQDFELSAFLTLALLCLLLLALLCGKSIVETLLGDQERILIDFRGHTFGLFPAFIPQPHGRRLNRQPPEFGSFELPLRI
jgi:hypothetical protein